MHYSVSHHKLNQLLAAHGLKSGDAGGIDQLFGGTDGYYWFGTLRDLCPPGKTLIWDDLYQMVNAIQAHENATAEEDEIVEAMKLVWKRMKLVIEPSSAVPLAVILKNRALFQGKRVGVIVTGGNVDLDKLPWM